MKGISLAAVISFLGIVLAPQLAKAEPLRPAATSAQNSRYRESEAAWQRISARNPGNAEAYYNLGIAQANQQKWQAAIDSYEKAIALDPGFVYAYCNLGRAQVKLEQYQAAALSYQRALDLDPEEVVARELLNELKIIAGSNGLDLAVR